MNSKTVLGLFFGLGLFLGCEQRKEATPVNPPFNSQPTENIRNSIDVISPDKTRALAVKAVEESTGDKATDFIIQELPLGEGRTQEYIFSYRSKTNRPPGSDIAVSVDRVSGSATLISE